MKKSLFLLICLIFFGCKQNELSTKEISFRSVFGQNLTLQTTKGSLKIKDSNKILIIDIFGTFCAPCKVEAKALTKFQIDHKDKIQILALNYGEKLSDEEIINSFVKPFNAYYFISNSDQTKNLVKQILKDINFKEKFGLPLKVIFKDGVLQSYFLGQITTKELQEQIDRIEDESDKK